MFAPPSNTPPLTPSSCSLPAPSLPAGPLLPLSPEQGELVWTHYIHMLRRVESDYHSRRMFLRARRWQQSLPASDPAGGCWRLYSEAALLEWRRGRDAAAARNIFEKGLEDTRVLREPAYVLAYLELLCGG